MPSDARTTRRYALLGNAALSIPMEALAGTVGDISLTGLSIHLAGAGHRNWQPQDTWTCSISALDLPANICCWVKVVWTRPIRDGQLVGCRIVEIDAENQGKLKAFSALALARASALRSVEAHAAPAAGSRLERRKPGRDRRVTDFGAPTGRHERRSIERRRLAV